MKSKTPNNFLLFLRSTYLEPGIVSFNPESRQNDELQDFLHSVELPDSDLRYTVSEDLVYLREFVDVSKVCTGKNLNIIVDLRWQISFSLKNLSLTHLEHFYIPWVSRYSTKNGFAVLETDS